MYSKASFPTAPRLTRSQKIMENNTQPKGLNVSYTTVIVEDNINEKKVDYNTQLIDLRNKLAISESIINDHEKTIHELKQSVRDRDLQIMILDDKVNKYINKSAVVLCNGETQTEDVEFETVKSDVSLQTDLIPCSDSCSQTESKILVNNCVQTNTELINEVFTQSQLPELNVVTEKIDNTSSKIEIEAVDTVIDGSSSASSNVKYGTRNRLLEDKWSPRVDPKIVIIGDRIASDLSSILKRSLPKRFQVSSTVKPGGSFEYVMEGLQHQASTLTKSDFIILLFSSSIITEINEDERLKQKFSMMIRKVSNTNVLCSTIAFDHGGRTNNHFIHSINEFIELELFKYKHK